MPAVGDALPKNHHFERYFYASVVLIMLALFPVSRALDGQDARPGPMYRDMSRVAQLESQILTSKGRGVAMDVQSPDGVAVGHQLFTPSDGVRIQVRLAGKGYCVKGENQHGDQSTWHCGTASIPAL